MAFAHTVLLFLIAGVLSLLFGTVLAAMRVGPIGVLRKAAGVYVTLVRNTPLLIVLVFFRIAGPKIGIQFNWVDIVWGDIRMTAFFAAAVVALTALHLGLRLRGASGPGSTPSRSARPRRRAPSACRSPT